MSKLLVMPLHVADYDRDTAGLSMIEHGCYYNLVRAYWNNGGPLPYDVKILSRLCGAQTKKERQICVEIASKYFKEVDGYLTHKRIDEEIKKIEDKSRTARDSVKRRWEKRMQKTDTNVLRTYYGRNTNLEPIRIINNTTKKEEEKNILKKENSIDLKMLQEKFEEFWEAYGKIGNKKPAFVNFEKAIKGGVSYDEIIEGLSRYRNYNELIGVDRKYIKHASTWLNCRGWQDSYEVHQQRSKIGNQVERVIAEIRAGGI